MKKMHLKKYKNKKFNINFIIILIVLLTISIYFVMNIFSKKAIPTFIEYSKIETKKIINLIVTSTVNNEISKKIDMDKLFIISRDSNNNIKTIDLDSSVVNNLLYETSNLVKQNLNYLENGEIDKITNYRQIFSNYDSDKLYKGIIYELPSGVIFNNIILINILPKIPLKIGTLGNVYSVINTDIESYGINAAMLKINIDVIAEVKILLPFITDEVEVTTSIPIVVKIIEGEIPSYYLGGYLGSMTN